MAKRRRRNTSGILTRPLRTLKKPQDMRRPTEIEQTMEGIDIEGVMEGIDPDDVRRQLDEAIEKVEYGEMLGSHVRITSGETIFTIKAARRYLGLPDAPIPYASKIRPPIKK
jgi:hypothetical protein